MKRFFPLFSCLIALVFAASAAAQGPLFVRLPQSGYDLTRDSTTKLATSDATGDTNSAVLNTELKKLVGYRSSGTPIKVPAIAPAGRYRLSSGITIGYRENGTTPVAGGQFLGAGGTTPVYEENTFNANMGAVTRFTYSGTPGNAPTTDLFTYVGRHWLLGPFELHGFTLTSSTDRDNRDTAFTKCRSGLTISKVASNFPNGHSTGVFSFMGFQYGIRVTPTPNENHCDTLDWPYLWFDTCDTCYYVDNQQSVGHYIDTIVTNSFVDNVFVFDNGGDLFVKRCKLDGANQTLLTINGGALNEGVFVIEGVRIDNNADNPVLVKIGAGRTSPVTVVISGSVGDGVTYTTADLVQGEDANDRIFIRFVGESDEITNFNNQSTVATSPL